jgi:anti-sigma factor RsiW
MRHNGEHVAECTLLQLLDDELRAREADGVWQHLAVCSACQSRLEALKSTSRAVHASLQNSAGIEPMRSSMDAKALLRSRLQLVDGEHQPPNSRAFSFASLQGWMLAATVSALFVVAIGVPLMRRAFTKSAGSELYAEAERLTPDRLLTPGATKPVLLEQVCSVSDANDELDPEVDASMRQAVFAKYGVRANGSGGQYQVDYLINPQLGGTADLQNLWPEPYTSSAWNARAKDALEERLHEMVCARQVDLGVAQREIAQDWIAAYRKYFHTRQPV